MTKRLEIAEAVKKFLDGFGEDYRYDEEAVRFEADIELECRLNGTRLFLVPQDDGLIVYASVHLEAWPETLLAAAEYITRVNHGLPGGNFELDMDNGMINYKMYVNCNDGPPSERDIVTGMAVPVAVINRYGDGLIDVIESGKPPKEAVIEAENRNRGE
ncbi:MAG: YbjN domain-containing protein [Defluviitaleaceae bacterium]|nr:YbjN domain-containing protein [Defluviitaleaceae bacterium]